jgi:hypothetical protein
MRLDNIRAQRGNPPKASQNVTKRVNQSITRFFLSKKYQNIPKYTKVCFQTCFLFLGSKKRKQKLKKASADDEACESMRFTESIRSNSTASLVYLYSSMAFILRSETALPKW